MSRKKKLSHKEKMRQRVANRLSGDDDLARLTPQAAYDEALDFAKQLAIPEDAIQAYAEAFEWAAAHRAEADELVALDEKFWANIVAGIAYAEKFNFPQEQIRGRAWQLRAWNILNGYKYCFDWQTPIAQMSDDEIIAQIRQDAADGKIPEPPPGE